MKLHEAQEKGIPKPCVHCGKPYMLPYGRWGDGGTCCRPCELAHEAKPKYERKDHELAIVPEASSNES